MSVSETTGRESVVTHWVRRLWRLLAVGFAVVAIGLALAIGLFRLLVPLVPDFHERIEAAAGGALGAPVTFERIDARWRLRGPELVFFGARVLDTEAGRTLLEAASGHVNLDVSAFLRHRAIVPDNVVLRGVDLELRRDASGRIALLGGRGDAGGGMSRWERWPVPNGRFELREATLRLVRDDAPPLEVPNLEANLEVDGDRLRLDGKMTPPAGMGDAIEISAEFEGRPADLDALRWQVYLAASDLRLAGVDAAVEGWRSPLAAGRGDAVLWMGFQGTRVQNASLDLRMVDLVVADYEDEPAYRRLSGRFEWDRMPLGWRAKAHDLFIERGGRAWPTVDASATFDRGQSDASRLRIVAPFLRLQDVAPLMRWLPVREGLDRLATLRPQGDVEALEVVAARGGGEPPTMTVAGKLRDLGWRPLGRMPGVQGLSGQLRSDALGGRLELDSNTIAVDAPNLFEETLTAWRLAGSLLWRQEGGRWRLIGDRVLLATEDFDAVGRVAVLLGRDGEAPEVDAHLNIGDLDVTRAARYLPARAMKPRLTEWLQRALQGGVVRSAAATLRGRLDRFPFDGGADEGLFSAELDIEDLDLNFARRWPSAEDLDARVRFAGRSLEADLQGGRFGRAELGGGRVEIADLTSAVLKLEAATEAPADALADYIVTTPAGERYATLLSALKLSGGASSSLTLTIPIKDWQSFTYRFTLAAQGVQLDYRDWPVALEAVRGNVVFTRDGLDAPDLEAFLLGRPIDLSLTTLPRQLEIDGEVIDTRTLVADAQGRTDANVLGGRLYEPLADLLRGSGEWQARLAFPPFQYADRVPLDITLESDLDGLAVLLPEPLTKQAEDARKVRATLRIPKDDEWILSLQYGTSLAGVLALGEGAERRRITRGAISLDGVMPVLGERPGVAVTGSLPRFDFDDWLSRRGEGGPPVAELLRTANVDVGQLRIFGQDVPDAKVMVDRNVTEWLIEIESEATAGAIFLPFDFASGAQVIANMQKLAWRSQGEGSGGADPRKLPNLRLDAQDFAFNDMRFGSLSLLTSQAEDGLSIDRFETQSDSFTASGRGTWRHAAAAPSDFLLTLDSTDVKSTLEALNTVGAIDAGEARFTLDLHWDGALDGNFVREVYGDVSVYVGDGQLLNVDPKAGRVFGLISLTALPRRLSLDFRDIFQKGFAFDVIEGDFSLRNGSAFTENLALRGPAAQVAIVGRAGIADRDYDQTASIFANFGASLPIAGALAAGPAVGAALLVLSEVFKDPLKEMGRVDYRITGTWDEPEIARLGATPPAEPPSEPPAGAPEPPVPEATPSG